MTRDDTRLTGEFLWADGDQAALGRAMAARSAGENFPVAVRLLPARQRRQLMAVYGFARVTDDIGDQAPPADRLRLLDELQADLERVNGGDPQLTVIRGLQPTVAELRLGIQPFLDLIEANRQDQVVSSYQTFDELLGYCRLSANPVGRIVLAVFGASGPRRDELSDQVCTALQLVEHWQDVAEDLRAGRIYLPAEDMAAHGCTAADLGADRASPQLRALIRFETERARQVLDAGAALVGTLSGMARLAIAGYVAGGRAAMTAIAAAGYDVLRRTAAAAPQPGRGRARARRGDGALADEHARTGRTRRTRRLSLL